MLWLTKRTVRPVPTDCLHLPQALLLKFRIPHRQHLVHNQYFRLQVGRHGKRQAHVHSRRITLHRRVQEILHLSQNATISSNFLRISCTRHPEDRTVEVDVFSGRSIRDETPCPPPAGSPRARRAPPRPSVGSVMRLRILSSVDLPAPLRPMMLDDLPALDLE